MNEQNDGNVSTADLAYGKQDQQETAMAQDQSAMQEDRSTNVRNDSAEESRETTALFPEEEASGYRTRWQDIQAKFVDEPKDCVEEADSLVAQVVQQLATHFAEQRSGLEGQWSKGSEVSTEDLRQALRNYRSFFQRLLAA